MITRGGQIKGTGLGHFYNNKQYSDVVIFNSEARETNHTSASTPTKSFSQVTRVTFESFLTTHLYVKDLKNLVTLLIIRQQITEVEIQYKEWLGVIYMIEYMYGHGRWNSIETTQDELQWCVNTFIAGDKYGIPALCTEALEVFKTTSTTELKHCNGDEEIIDIFVENLQLIVGPDALQVKNQSLASAAIDICVNHVRLLSDNIAFVTKLEKGEVFTLGYLAWWTVRLAQK